MSIVDDAHTVRGGADDDPLVLLLHGYGSNENDLPGLAEHLPPGLAYASVRAPLTVGAGSYAWVPIRVPGRPDPAATAAATEALLMWFDDHVAVDRTVVLLGFSQGGLMVTQLLRSRPGRFVAALVLSGFVLDAAMVGDDELASVPVFFGHGDADPVIVPDATQRASAWLSEHTSVTDRSYVGLGHGICGEEIVDIEVFLRRHVL
ncbi:MAG: putative esterase [Aeromicrobium sp.]|nr:putative esterase [Aeromicrobium sp.]